MAFEGTTAKVADRLSQSVLSVHNLAELIRNTSPIQANAKLPKELLAKASSIKNTGVLLQQMPGVIAALDAHSDKSLVSFSELETILSLLNQQTNADKQSNP
ncbi:hypothetical protein GOP47_0019782 [Adiantum capillus-veneris]|uniref:Uncharacterized protein n=1 Tax=Adiantum capillus-veneris TaxID=13818 RepID=A0A9D4UC65_ADICA|nr:hypothetical protein GOP47_0019782 [Adiantum capillus-veneris]